MLLRNEPISPYLSGMATPLSIHSELIPFFDRQEFIVATLNQINKDLQGLYYGDYTLEPTHEKPVLEQLVQSLVPILLELSKRQPEQLSQFIYRVDLQEKKFTEALYHDSGLYQLAHLIIEREALKVWLRLKFS